MAVNALPKSVRRFVTAVVVMVELVIYMVVMWYVLRFTWNSIDIGRTMQIGTDFWPVWPIVVMMPLAFGLMMLEMLRLIWRDIRNGGDGGPQQETDNVSAAF